MFELFRCQSQVRRQTTQLKLHESPVHCGRTEGCVVHVEQFMSRVSNMSRHFVAHSNHLFQNLLELVVDLYVQSVTMLSHAVEQLLYFDLNRPVVSVQVRPAGLLQGPGFNSTSMLMMSNKMHVQ